MTTALLVCSMQTRHKYTYLNTYRQATVKTLPRDQPPNVQFSSALLNDASGRGGAGALGGGGRHVGGPAHLIGSLQGPLAVLQDGAEGDVGVLLHQLFHRHFVDLQTKKSHHHAQRPTPCRCPRSLMCCG